jgi:phosphohistidine phosphatase
MRFAIVRHGEAAYGADSDASRQLTELGHKEAESTANQLKPWITERTKIIHSPYLRTIQTAQIMADVLSLDMVQNDVLQAGTPYEQIVDWLQQTELTDFILISHNPMVTQIANVLVYGQEGLRRPMLMFDTAYACCLECEYPAAGCVELIQRIIP